MLADFYKDVETRKEVREYLSQFVKDEAVRMMLGGQDVSHVKLANDFISAAWDNLDLVYGSKPKPRTENEAR